ncbi:MAG: DUF1569 domain-containing protein [Gemmatirosa sp.]|nr:DUF1569 domain-containing protein [Gemmatirosa sp.]
MPTLHDPAHRAAIDARVRALRPDSARRWGRMSIDQMLWHVNEALELALGRTSAAPVPAPVPMPKAVLRTLVLALPWPKGVRTMPTLLARDPHDFVAEHGRCLALVDAMAARDVEGAWPSHPMLGAMQGRHWSALMAKHLCHHLTQFGV